MANKGMHMKNKSQLNGNPLYKHNMIGPQKPL